MFDFEVGLHRNHRFRGLFHGRQKIIVDNPQKERVNEFHEYLRGFVIFFESRIKTKQSAQEIWDLLHADTKQKHFAAVRNGIPFFMVKKVNVQRLFWENSRGRSMKIKRKTFNNLVSMISNETGAFSKEFYP